MNGERAFFCLGWTLDSSKGRFIWILVLMEGSSLSAELLRVLAKQCHHFSGGFSRTGIPLMQIRAATGCCLHIYNGNDRTALSNFFFNGKKREDCGW